MDDQNKNLILATALSFLVILVWFVLFPPQESTTDPNLATTTETASVPGVAAVAPQSPAVAPSPDVAKADAPRVEIDTPRLAGGISLQGGRIDALSLKDYRETLEAGSPNVTLLTPVGQPEAYYALFAWAPGGDLDFADVPGPDTVWQIESGNHAHQRHAGDPRLAEWQRVRRSAARSKSTTTSCSVSPNRSRIPQRSTARLAAYSQIRRHGEPTDLKKFFVIHEGPIRQSGEELNELDYKDLRKLGTDARWGANAEVVEVAGNGWIGFTDHYWMTNLIPASDQPFTSVLKYDQSRDIYISEARLPAVEVGTGQSASFTTQLFRWRQGMGHDPRLSERGRDLQFPGLYRLGLVLFPDQADLCGSALAEQRHRQHGLVDHRADPDHQGHRIPAGLQILCLDGAA